MTNPGWTIGTAPDCHMTIVDEYASPIHALITRDTDGRVYVEDLGSTNGTRVTHHGATHKVIAPRQIWPGDTIIIGRTKIPWSLKP